MIKIRLTALLFVTTTFAFAQHVLMLTNGIQIHGRYDGGNADNITFIDEHGSKHKFNIAEVQALIVSGPLPPPPQSAEGSYAPGAPPPPPAFAERGYADTDVQPNAGWSRSGTIPAGTEIVVRTIDPIEARRPDPRQHFLASVEQDVLDASGNVVIPRGSPAHLIVHEVAGGELALDLRSVSVNGRRLILNNEDITNTRVRDGLGANKRTGAFVGGTALLGTVFGAIAGGGKGAAIGALAGAGAGAGAEVITRGSALHIPSETILRFRLDHPVYLYQ